MTMKTDREICAAATAANWIGSGALVINATTGAEIAFVSRLSNRKHIINYNPQKVAQMLDKQEQLESKLKEAAEFIQKLGPTIDYDIVAEIEEMLGE